MSKYSEIGQLVSAVFRQCKAEAMLTLGKTMALENSQSRHTGPGPRSARGVMGALPILFARLPRDRDGPWCAHRGTAHAFHAASTI